MEVDRALSKIVCLAGFAVVSAFGFSYFLLRYIENGDSGFFWLGAGSGIIFLSVFLLNVFFIKARWRANLIIFIEALGLLAGLYSQFSLSLFWGILAAALILIWAGEAGLAEIKNLLTVKFWRVGKRSLPKAILALSLVSGIAYYLNVAKSDWREPKNFLISEPTFEKIIKPTSPLLKKFFPAVDLESATGDVLRNLALDQVEKNPEFKILSQSQKKVIIEKLIEESEKQLGEATGIKLGREKRVGENLYYILLQKIVELPEKVQSVIPQAAAALIVLTILSVSWLIRWLATVMAWIIYEILLALGFAVLAMEGRSREIVLLK